VGVWDYDSSQRRRQRIEHRASSRVASCLAPLKTLTTEYHGNCRHQDSEIQPERPPGLVPDVQTYHFLECGSVLAANLPQPRQAWNDIETSSLPHPVFQSLIQDTWAWTDQTHVATKDVNQLR
jgi:hypothetical protein